MMENNEIYLWWYYNYSYSETGGIFKNLHNALQCIKQGPRKSKGGNYRIIKKAIKEKGYYDDRYWDKLIKIKFNGTIDQLYKANCLYILRYPLGIYTSKKEACKVGALHVINNSSGYNWLRLNKPLGKGSHIECDEAWYEKVLGKNYTSIDWKLIWQARIEEEDMWSSINNHIETVYDGEFSFIHIAQINTDTKFDERWMLLETFILTTLPLDIINIVKKLFIINATNDDHVQRLTDYEHKINWRKRMLEELPEKKTVKELQYEINIHNMICSQKGTGSGKNGNLIKSDYVKSYKMYQEQKRIKWQM